MNSKSKLGVVRVGQSITICARVFDAYNSELVFLDGKSNVESISYSLFKLTKSVFGEKSTPVEGHSNVSVSTECLLNSVKQSPNWTIDDKGYNFAMTPDIRDFPLFDAPGKYRFRITILPKAKSANPIVFYQDVLVEK